MRHSFSIIIPNYNGATYLKDCIQSVTNNINTTDLNFEIILVDNGSSDTSLEVFSKSFSVTTGNYHCKVIKLNSNHGFAYAVNQGIKAADYPWVVLLNNDLTLEANWFSLISKAIKTHPQAAAICGTVLNKDGSKIESQGLLYFAKGKCLNINNGKPYLHSAVENLPSQYIWGASAALIVYRKDIIEKIGLFDEDFFAYEEDVDVAYRLSKLGYKTLYLPPAISYHLGGGTSSKMGNFRHRHDAKNRILLILKNYSLHEIVQNLPAIIEERLRNLSGLIKNTYWSYNLRSVYLIPYFILTTYSQIIVKLPSLLQKRRYLKKLLQSHQ